MLRPSLGRTMPSSTSSSSAGMPRASAASATRWARACAAAWRSGRAETWMESEAMVPPWLGATPVWPSTMVTRSSVTSSSSATIWASAVRMPVPRSTWPLKAVTAPWSSTSRNRSSAPSFGTALGTRPCTTCAGRRMARLPVAARSAAGSGRGSLTAAPPLHPCPRRPAARHAGSPHASRSGTDCSATPRGPRLRWGRDCARGRRRWS